MVTIIPNHNPNLYLSVLNFGSLPYISKEETPTESQYSVCCDALYSMTDEGSPIEDWDSKIESSLDLFPIIGWRVEPLSSGHEVIPVIRAKDGDTYNLCPEEIDFNSRIIDMSSYTIGDVKSRLIRDIDWEIEKAKRVIDIYEAEHGIPND